MALIPGKRLGPFEILAPLGAGGMGEVYRAKDTRLGRDVAIKVLPEHLSRHPEARSRFEREAKAVSSLSHPHICTLHDVGREEDVDFLVMEYLEGETLFSRLERGPLPLEEIVRTGAQIADALAAAHRRGVVHRDLKPGNVMLTKAGVKLLDFGLAKEAGAGSISDLTSAPTMDSPLTTEGAIVGTFHYMAPEQLEGREADARSDLWALGAVLYETTTGTRAFEGKTQASVIGAILHREPASLAEMQPPAHPGLVRLIGACLAKDPDDRWQSAGDLKRELEWIARGSADVQGVGSGVPVSQRLPGPAWARWTAAAVLAAALVGLGWFLHRPAPLPDRVLRSSIVLARGTALDTDNASIALSPDGTALAFAAREPGGPLRIFLRRLDSLTAQPLAGTEGATYPFWSPDGRSLGFFADRKLKKIPASGGTVQSICEAEDGRGASWGADDVIVFAPRPLGGLAQVAASGGTPTPLTTPTDAQVTQRNPRFLPDGRRVLFFSGKNKGDEGNGIFSLDLTTKKASLVIPADSEGVPVEPGYLAFVRDGNLMAQRIDLASLRTSGDAMPIAENVQFNTFRYTGTYTFSGNSLLLYQSGAILGEDQLTWYDLEGKRLGTVGDPAIFWLKMGISPDGRKAVATVRHPSARRTAWSRSGRRTADRWPTSTGPVPCT